MNNVVEVNVDNFDSRGFQTDGVDSIPLPIVPALELRELPAMAALPAMPDLDEILDFMKNNNMNEGEK